MRSVKHFGQGLAYIGLLFQINSGLAVGSSGLWFLLGLALILLGVVLMVIGRSPKD
jgi:hypothetical protein